MTKVTKEPTGAHSPLYGCAILIMVVLTFGGIIAWVLFSGYQQDKEIGSFTVENALPLPVAAPSSDEKAVLQAKLKSFGETTALGKPVELTLSLAELNILLVLAGESQVADYRGIVVFTALDATSQLIRADLCWEMNQLPFSKKAKRHLVGQGAFKPVIENNALDLKIDTLAVPNKSVSYGFLRNLQQWPWLNLAKLKPEIAAPLKKVTSWAITSDGQQLLLQCSGNTSQK